MFANWQKSSVLSPTYPLHFRRLASFYLTLANTFSDFRHWRVSSWRKSYWRISVIPTFCTSIQLYCISISPIVVTVLLLSFVYIFLLSIMFLYCISLYMCSILCTTNYHSLNWYDEELNTTNCFRLIIVKCFTITIYVAWTIRRKIIRCEPVQIDS